MAKYQLCSVALLLVNPQDQLYCVRERMAKPQIGKLEGHHSFPWETVEPDERPIRTLHRLITEEIDATDTVAFAEPIPVWIGDVEVHNSLAHIFLARFKEGPAEMRGLHAGIEIDPLGWCSSQFLLSHCRDGVPEALRLWQQHKRAILEAQV